jgi:2,3-diketo-5-methylthio-1-phosphopentane phosphatase
VSALLALDFDGTITDADAPDALAREFAADRWEATEARLAAGEISAPEALARELAPVTLAEDAAVGFLLAATTPRPGLDELLAHARARAWETIVVSDGVQSYIEAFLRRAGHALPVLAHPVRFSPAGAQVPTGGLERCPACGTTCKRPRLLRAAAGRPVVYVGDGLSDRCPSLAVRHVFARAGLAEHLGAHGVPYTPFATLSDVARQLPALE